MSVLPFKQHLHSLIYVVADKPTKANLSSDVPLVGTKSYKTFLSWAATMDIDVTRMRMYNQCDDPFPGFAATTLNVAIKAGHTKVIALGKKAEEYLLDVGVDEFYSLPHPSGRNLKVNHKKELKHALSQCRAYIHEGLGQEKDEINEKI